MTASENAPISSTPASAPEPRPADRPPNRPVKGRPARQFPWMGTGLVLALIVILVLGAALWRQQRLVENIGRESARRFSEVETAAREAQMRAGQALSTTQGNTDKLAVLESKVLESQSQQAALEQLYQEMSRGEDEWTLIEVEQALSIASQQLQLAGNVPNSIAALQVADARLARADRPQFTVIRRAIAQDLERLRGLPSVDVSGLVVKLDQLIQQLDKLPLLASVGPARRGADAPVPTAAVAAAPATSAPAAEAPTAAVPAAAEPAAAAPAVAEPPTAAESSAAVAPDAATTVTTPPAPTTELSWWDRVRAWWGPVRAGFLDDMRDVIRIQRLDTPEALLVSPDQAGILRENLKLRLLNARLALLSRQQHAWQADLAAVEQAIPRYFDAQAPATESALASLRQIRNAEISIELPSLNDSLTAVRAVLPRSAVGNPSQR